MVRQMSVVVIVVVLCAGCAAPAPPTPDQPAADPTTAAALTADPAATPEAALTTDPTTTPIADPGAPRLAEDARIAGVNVGGLTRGEAGALLGTKLDPLFLPLTLQAGSSRTVVRPEDIGVEIGLAAMLDAALAQGAGARVSLALRYNEPALRALLTRLSTRGTAIDTEAALRAIDQRLRTPLSSRRVTLPLQRTPIPAAQRANPDALQQLLLADLTEWPGVASVTVFDRQTNREIASVNRSTVFSAASTMKMPIALYIYALLPTFSETVDTLLNEMLIDSDNLAANKLLAASVGGAGPDDVARGALEFTDFLRSLGLERSYMLTGYVDDITPIVKLADPGPEYEGPEPLTVADAYLRTTAAELSQLYVLLEECRAGRGTLIARFPQTMSAERCTNLLDRLAQPRAHEQAALGLPGGTFFAHKGGWVEDMAADVGSVRSPGGDFIIALFVYDDVSRFDAAAADETISRLARTIYGYYNPN